MKNSFGEFQLEPIEIATLAGHDYANAIVDALNRDFTKKFGKFYVEKPNPAFAIIYLELPKSGINFLNSDFDIIWAFVIGMLTGLNTKLPLDK